MTEPEIPSPRPQFSLLQLLGLFTVLGALLAITVQVGCFAFPLWLAAILMWLILSPRRDFDSSSNDPGSA